MRKVIVYIASSADGFIAKDNDNLDFLSVVQKEGEDYGYADFIQSVDTVIMGRKTYDWVMKHVAVFPHADKNSFIITTKKQENKEKLTFYNESLPNLISELKLAKGKNIFVDGGAEVINELIKHQLIDEFIISYIPIFLGSGIRLFKQQQAQVNLQLVSAKNFSTGLVQIHYKVL